MHEARAVAGSASIPHTGSWVAAGCEEGDSWLSVSFGVMVMAPHRHSYAARLNLPVAGKSSGAPSKTMYRICTEW